MKRIVSLLALTLTLCGAGCAPSKSVPAVPAKTPVAPPAAPTQQPVIPPNAKNIPLPVPRS